ncbi:hypothetical protein [Agrobacterium sp. P15N1-A]|uniref:hypothetical protein n=1 Tax=Agrobacterium sp. P15N1-A TaxID=3342820 RepID=UPI0037D4D1AB
MTPGRFRFLFLFIVSVVGGIGWLALDGRFGRPVGPAADVVELPPVDDRHRCSRGSI